jgi:TrpR-related protein YerC/YecD
MAQVSRAPLSKEVYERVFEIFFKTIVKITSKKEAESFFRDFLTPTEKIVLAKRLSIAILLTKNYDYETIRQVLHVSPPTIATVNRPLKYGGEGYKMIIGKLLREEEVKEVLINILGDFANLGALGGSAVWRGVRTAIQRRKKKPI